MKLWQSSLCHSRFSFRTSLHQIKRTREQKSDHLSLPETLPVCFLYGSHHLSSVLRVTFPHWFFILRDTHSRLLHVSLRLDVSFLFFFFFDVSFLTMLNYISLLQILWLVYPFPYWRTLLLPTLASMNKAAMNICVLALVWIYTQDLWGNTKESDCYITWQKSV